MKKGIDIMPWSLVLICTVVFALFLALHGLSGASRPCPKGCHGCGRCMNKGVRKDP